MKNEIYKILESWLRPPPFFDMDIEDVPIEKVTDEIMECIKNKLLEELLSVKVPMNCDMANTLQTIISNITKA